MSLFLLTFLSAKTSNSYINLFPDNSLWWFRQKEIRRLPTSGKRGVLREERVGRAKEKKETETEKESKKQEETEGETEKKEKETSRNVDDGRKLRRRR